MTVRHGVSLSAKLGVSRFAHKAYSPVFLLSAVHGPWRVIWGPVSYLETTDVAPSPSWLLAPAVARNDAAVGCGTGPKDKNVSSETATVW